MCYVSPLLVRLPVSNFARDLLAKIYCEPVFKITSKICTKIPQLSAAKVGCPGYTCKGVAFRCPSLLGLEDATDLCQEVPAVL